MKPKLFSLLAAGVFALGIGASQASSQSALTCSQACRLIQQHCLDAGGPPLECRSQYLECMVECQG